MFEPKRITSLLSFLALMAAACVGEGEFTFETPAEENPKEEAGPGGMGRRTQELSEDGRYIVSFDGSQPNFALMSILAANGNVVRELPSASAVAVYLDDEAVYALADDPRIRAIEPDRRREILGAPSGSQATPYGIGMVQAPDVWPEADGEGITVCVIDSGLDVGHESIQTQNLTGSPAGWNNDGCGHGTHVAGTIAAVDNGVGVVGVLPAGVKMHTVKVFGDWCWWSYTSDLIHALEECRSAGADVVNMSLGGPSWSLAESLAFQNAYDAGVLLVAAAGNDGNGAYSYPASYDSVISVAALDQHMNRASFSQYNDQVEIAAPGVAVLSTTPMSGCWGCDGASRYEAWDGTSMASPHVAGVAALIWSYNRAWTNADIRQALRATAMDLGAAGRDPYYGYGLVQAAEALAFLRSGSCLETGCEGESVCNPESGVCEAPAAAVALYDFDGQTKAPTETAAGVVAGPFDNRDGDAGFVAGRPGDAITDNGWRDGDGNYFEMTLTPDAGLQVAITGIAFDERPSATGPVQFEVQVLADGVAVAVATGTTAPGSWREQSIHFANTPALTEALQVRIVGLGASSGAGTWRLDNVRVDARVQAAEVPPVIVSEPPATVQAGSAYAYTVVAEGEGTPVISATGLPSWLAFDGVATLSGVAPSYAVGQTDPITVFASIGSATTAQTFSIEVVPAAARPVSGDPIVEGFADGLPPGWHADGGWAVGAPTSGPGAAYEGFAVAATYLHGNYPVPTHAYLSTPVLDFSGMDDAVVRFQSWHQVDGCWHGVNVLFSLDGGATFHELAPSTVSPAYDGAVEAYEGAQHSAMAGQQAWCGESGGWRAVSIDLEANLAGQDRSKVVVVLQLGTDDVGPRAGWYVDAVRIGSAAEIAADEAPAPSASLALFDFEGDVKTPVSTAAGLTVGAMDNRDGDARFVLGNPGRALTDNGWRDDDANYFEFEVVPEAGRYVLPTGLAFDERASGTGPTHYEIAVVIGGIAYPVPGGSGTIEAGSWATHSVPEFGYFAAAEPSLFTGAFKVRIAARGASSGSGTWRVDNVRLTGYVY
jgi:hypothetical protein